MSAFNFAYTRNYNYTKLAEAEDDLIRKFPDRRFKPGPGPAHIEVSISQ